MDNLGIVIQARMGSTRLPKKVLMDFCGKPLVLFQVEVLNAFNLGADIVIATSTKASDDPIEALCKQHQIPCVRGSETNVFNRYQMAAEQFKFDTIVRLTGDNPLPHCSILKACLTEHQRSRADLTSTREILPDRSVRRFTPKGCSVDVLKAKTLRKMTSDTLDTFQKEHVIPVFFEHHHHVELVKSIEGFNPPPIPLSIDDENDLKSVENYTQTLIEQDKLWETLGLHSPKNV